MCYHTKQEKQKNQIHVGRKKSGKTTKAESCENQKKQTAKQQKQKKRQNSGKTTFKGGVEDDDVEKDDGKRNKDGRIGIGNLGFICLGPDRLWRKKGGTGEQFYGRI